MRVMYSQMGACDWHLSNILYASPSIKVGEPWVKKRHRQRSSGLAMVMKAERAKIIPRQTPWSPSQTFPSLGKKISS
jgi:hypothetical protein